MIDMPEKNADADAIGQVLSCYLKGPREANSALMRPAFAEEAAICGFLGPDKFAGPIEMLFSFVDSSEPSTGIGASVKSFYLSGGIAVVVAEVVNWAGHDFEDILTFVKFGNAWKISSKAFRLVA